MVYCIEFTLPAQIEMFVQIGLAVIFWLIGGRVYAARGYGFPFTRRRGIIAMFFLNMAMSIGSAVVCFFIAKDEDLPKETQEPPRAARAERADPDV